MNVNPLVSLQVSKDDEGEKVLKPFVNLHLTPNPGLVHKFGSLVHNLKGYGHGYGGYGYPPVQHQHYHQHQHKPPHSPYYSRPYPSYGHGPPHIKPIYESYPSYAPSFTRYRTEPPYDNSLYDYEPSSSSGGYSSSGPEGYNPSLGYGLSNDEPSGYDNSDDYFRNSKSLPLTPNDGQSQQQNDETQAQANSNFAFQDNGAASKSYQLPEQQKQNTVAFPSDRRSSDGAVAFEGQSRQKRDTSEEAAEKQDDLVDVQKVS